MDRFIISGGGTGGHVFPALAIGHAIRRRINNAEILFVGAEGKMEMEKVPKAGFEIIGLPISGLQRSLTWKNVLFPFKLLHSYIKAGRIVSDFAPSAVIGVGGYASWPMVAAAIRNDIPTVIQEQNSYAGLANKRLGKKVNVVCVAYEGMEKYFPSDKIVMTGNPVRSSLIMTDDKSSALAHFGLDPEKKTILLFGGSLGAGTLNESMAKARSLIETFDDVQFIWQIGNFYADTFLHSGTARLDQVKPVIFIDRMDLAYQLADLVICRAGALTISELCLLAKPSILVPSPNVAEDHQTSNAMAMVEKGAAKMIRDSDAEKLLMTEAIQLIHDKEMLQALSGAAGQLGRADATESIVNEVLKVSRK